MNSQQYIKKSLELHLVFLRLMKEHALFIAASLPSKNQNLIKEAKAYNARYNNLLSEVLNLSFDVVNRNEAMITNITLALEDKTQKLLGIPIDMELSKKELEIKARRLPRLPTEDVISKFNQKVIDLNEQFILFKTRLINNLLDCELFSSSYPEMIIHDRVEALDYISMINDLERKTLNTFNEDDIKNWNCLMIDHAEFIKGLLDPSEQELIELADEFIDEGRDIKVGPNFYNESLAFVRNIQHFKEQAATLISNCEIRSIIVPLLSDHILREANFYLIKLESLNE